MRAIFWASASSAKCSVGLWHFISIYRWVSTAVAAAGHGTYRGTDLANALRRPKRRDPNPEQAQFSI